MSRVDAAVMLPMPERDELPPVLQWILRRVRLRAQRRSAWLRKLWSEEGEPGGKQAVTHAEIDTHLADKDAPAVEVEWLASAPEVAQWNRELADVEAALKADRDSRLAQLRDLFALGDKELDLLQTCLALLLDPSLGRVYAYLQDHAGRAFVTEELVARLFGHGRTGVWDPGSPLARWALVEQHPNTPGEPPYLGCDPLLRDWLKERLVLDSQLLGIASPHPPGEPLVDWPVAETAAFIERLLQEAPPVRVCVRIVGPPGSGRRTLAATIGARLDLPLLAIDSDAVDEGRGPWVEIYRRAQRQAYLDRAALAWSGESLTRRAWPRTVPPFPVQFLILEAGQTVGPWPDLVERRIEVSAPGPDERRTLWQSYLPASRTWRAVSFAALVQRHRVTVGEIASVARTAPESAEVAAQQVRELRRQRLGRLAQRVDCPFGWEDLVVPERIRRVLDDLVFEAEHRGAFWERSEARRLFPQGRGLLVLFTGSPGTGKTMAAQVMAAELGLDLFRIDLSAVISKYVGETSQNLERILSKARTMDAVLLFDEADALFGKRTEIKDAHDRFANTDTDYLLQAVEDYQGVAVLSTNNKGNLDPAFIRRLRYVLEFPKPDASQRLAIWQRVVRTLAGSERLAALDDKGRSLGVGLGTLAAALELTGAQIKYAVLSGVFAAQRCGRGLTLGDLLQGVDRELMKEGRALSERERERILA
jgi:adenylate kinase family enzyme